MKEEEVYTKIEPLGVRNGKGTFDCLFDTKYTTLDEAEKANDYVVMDFVKDSQEVKFFEVYHIQSPDIKKRLRLQIQHFPFGIDMIDDNLACELASTMFLKK